MTDPKKEYTYLSVTGSAEDQPRRGIITLSGMQKIKVVLDPLVKTFGEAALGVFPSQGIIRISATQEYVTKALAANDIAETKYKILDL